MDKSQKAALFIAMIITLGILYYQANKQAEYLKARQAAEEQQQALEENRQPIKAESIEGHKQGRTGNSAEDSSSTSETAKSPSLTADATDYTEKELKDNIVVKTQEFEAIFTSKGAALKKYTLTNFFRTTKDEIPMVLLDKISPELSLAIDKINIRDNLENWNYTVAEYPSDQKNPDMPKQLVFTTIKDKWKITKTYTFAPDNYDRKAEDADPALRYGFRVKIKFENLNEIAQTLVWKMNAISGFIPDDIDHRYSVLNSMLATPEAKDDTDGIEQETLSQRSPEDEGPLVKQIKDLQWVGVKGRFFTTILRMEQPEKSGETVINHIDMNPETFEYLKDNQYLLPFIKPQPHSGTITYETLGDTIKPGNAEEYSFFFYGGPMTNSALGFDKQFQNIVSYSYVGIFEPISRILAKVLAWLYSFIGNYGFAIILLTLMLKTALHGTTKKMLTSGHEMQKIQPLMKELREKYKGNQKKLQEEMMRVYRERGVSPMGSCLPMFIQLPIFIALYGVFARTFEMRQAMFIPYWIEDLSLPDRLFSLGFSIPIVNWQYFNVLPILYVVLQLIQQSMTPKSNDPQVQQQQAMMKFMPIFFMFIFYSMPSGLVLYFTTSAAYTLVEHWFIRSKLEAKDAAKGEGEKSMAGAGQGFKKKDKKK
jgi:YidC/Oxa1 family membrane protein insertase